MVYRLFRSIGFAPAMHAFKRRLLAEDLVRLRRAEERRRFAASQRVGRIDPNPHQIDAVVFALKRIPEGGCILADEVGLGKTIEAGLVIAQVLAEGMRRVLLIVPKSLLGQWQTELYTLFGIEAREGRADPEAFEGGGVFLVHREFAGGVRGSSLLAASEPFDLAVIDEAHEVFAGIYKRFDKEGEYRRDSGEAQIADRVRSFLRPAGTPVLLLTATPIQNSLAELWGLVQYVERTDQLLGRLPTFREMFCGDGASALDGDQIFELRRRLGSVVQRTLRRQAQEFLEVPFVQRRTRIIEYTMTADERRLYDEVTQWLMDPFSCSFGGRNRRLLLIGFHRRMGSSLAALRASLRRVSERLRDQLRGASAGWDEIVADVTSEFELDEEDLGDLESAEPGRQPPTRERLGAELALVEGFVARAEAIGAGGKSQYLLDALRVVRERRDAGGGTGKAVIFTESLKTQDFLADLLAAQGHGPGRITLFRGDNEHPRAFEALERWEREVGSQLTPGTRPSRSIAIRLALVHEFRTRSDVFISTEAGAKGLNLQFCETLVNYDLPWNPQRIEQRIGRVHRYGQRRDVTILNFLDRGNEAQRLTFEILSRKLDLFGTVLDASDAVLYEPGTEDTSGLISGLGVEFEGELRRIYQSARSVEDVTEQLRALRASLEDQRSAFEREQSRVASLIGARLDESVSQMFSRWQAELPAELESLDRDLDALLESFLTAIGVPHEREVGAGRVVHRIPASGGLPTGCAPGVFVVGHVGGLDEGDPLHVGHPLIMAAVAESRRATAGPLDLEFRPHGTESPELAGLVGKSGRIVVTKIAYRGFEAVDHVLVTAIVEGEPRPLPASVVGDLLALDPVHAAAPISPSIDETALRDAVDETVLADQAATTREDEQIFERRLEQLDRYLDDQILLLRRRRDGLLQKVEEAQRRREGATAPSAASRANETIRSLEREMARIESRIDELLRGEDADYRQWRERLFERRFAAPTVERILEADYRVVAGGGAC